MCPGLLTSGFTLSKLRGSWDLTTQNVARLRVNAMAWGAELGSTVELRLDGQRFDVKGSARQPAPPSVASVLAGLDVTTVSDVTFCRDDASGVRLTARLSLRVSHCVSLTA